MFYFQGYELRQAATWERWAPICGIEAVWLTTLHLPLSWHATSAQYWSVKNRNNQAYSLQIWCYSNINFLLQICFCPQKFSNSFLPDMRRLAPRKASTKKRKKKSITSNNLTPPSTNPAALYEANEFLHQHIECYIAWWMLMAATSL